MKNTVLEMISLIDTDTREYGNGNSHAYRTYAIGDKRRIEVSESRTFGRYHVRVSAKVYDPHDYVSFDGERETIKHTEWSQVFSDESSNERFTERLIAQAYGVLVCLQD